MIKSTALVGILASLAFPGLAAAKRPTAPYTAQQTLNAAVADADAYWGGNPPCGAPTIKAEPVSYLGQTQLEACTIILSSISLAWADPTFRDFAQVCRTLTHEWGHLVLGSEPFATTNPSDPGHSPDPHNIMYAAATVTPRTCLAHAPRVYRLPEGGPVVRTVGHLSADGMTLTDELMHL